MFGFIGQNPKRKKGSPYDPDALAWFNYAPVPADQVAERAAYNTWTLTGKAQGWRAKLGYHNYYSPSSFSAACKDNIGLTTGTTYGGMNSSFWTTGLFGGMSYDGVGFLDTGFNPSSSGLISSTAASMGHRCPAGIVATGYVMGCHTSSTSDFYLFRGLLA